SDRGSELESVPGEPGYDQDAFELRVPVDNEVIIRRIVINTHTCLENASIGEAGAKLRKEFTASVYELFVNRLIDSVGIDERPLVMIGDLHRVRMMNRKPIES